MAKQPSLLTTASMLRGNFDFSKAKSLTKITDTLRDSASASLFSGTERKSLIRNVMPSGRPPQEGLTPTSLKSYISSVADSISRSSLDNQRILDMAPEVNQAAELVIPSIISPSDMRQNALSITCDAVHSGLPQAAIDSITSVISRHFKENLAFDDKLPDMIREALYISGAKVLAVIPTSSLDQAFNDPDALVAMSNESFNDHLNTFTKEIKTGLFGKENAFSMESMTATAKTAAIEECSKEVGLGIDALMEDFVASFESLEPKKTQDGRNKDAAVGTRRESYNDDFKSLYTAITDTASLEVLDNPGALREGSVRRAHATAMVKRRLKDRYRPTAILSMGASKKPAIDAKKADHPLFMELPTESVIPLYVPGNPQTHVGYFVAIDEKGNPIKADRENQKDTARARISEDGRRSPFEQMFRAYGLDELRAATGANKTSRTMAAIYQQILDHHLKARLNDLGMTDVIPAEMNSIYHHLFSRYLEGRKVRLLYMPPELITYMCYRYNEDGTGRSKLEDIKFILALRITLLYAKTMAAVNNSIDHKTVEITLGEDALANGLGDPLRVLNDLKREFVNKSMFGFTTDPEQIAQTMAAKSVSVKANGIPGIQNLQVSSEGGTRRQRSSPDSELMDDIRNLLILGLDVPPSALNMLSENEYSRSIATVSLFFARKIAQKQSLTVSHLTDFIRCYVRYDGVIIAEIIEILKNLDAETESASDDNKDKDNTSTDAGTINEEAAVEDKDLEQRVDRIIESISAHLPPPNIAPDSAQFENFRSFIGAVTEAVDAMLNADLAAGDAEAEEALTAIRAYMKTHVFTKYMEVNGFSDCLEFPDVKDLVGPDTFNFRQMLINLYRGLKSTKEALEAADDKASGEEGGDGSGYPTSY